MGDGEDRAAILERRKRLLASALSGVAMGALGLGAQACACLWSVMDASPQPCLSAAGVPPDAGPADAGHDAGADDAGADGGDGGGSGDGGSDAAV